MEKIMEDKKLKDTILGKPQIKIVEEKDGSSYGVLTFNNPMSNKCPKCKKPNTWIVNIPDPEQPDDLAFIECSECKYTTGEVDTLEKAIEIWNTIDIG
jgi:hypothetical protein